jgi:O-antigen/teichoic acid export membrane protein
MRLIVQTTTSQSFAEGLPSDDKGLFIFSAFACVAWPSLTTLALLADELIPFVLGPDWTQAAPIVVIFATFRCLTLFDGVFSANLVSYGKQKTLLKFQILTCIFAIFAIVTLLSYGTMGAAIANMIAGVVLTLLTASQAYKLHVITKKSMVQILILPFFVTALTFVSSATIIVVLKCNHVDAKFLVSAVVITALFAWCFGMWGARRKLSIAIKYLK